MNELQYSDRLKTLGTESLEQRQLKPDLCMYFKIIVELVDLPVDEFFSFKQGITRNNGACIYKNSFRLNSERFYFRNRCISAWNSLPASVVQSTAFNVFKRCLDSIDFHYYLRSRYDLAN